MPKITALFAFVSIGSDPDDEGIMEFQTYNETWMPMIGSDMTRINELKPIADKISKIAGTPY